MTAREDRVRVLFTPSGRQGDVAAGTIVLDAARSLGVDLDSIFRSLDLRKPGSVRARLRELYTEKLVDRGSKDDYRLTSKGFNKAAALVVALAA